MEDASESDIPQVQAGQEEAEAPARDGWLVDTTQADHYNATQAVIQEDESRDPALTHPVVAFGSSAGGLQPFRTILEGLGLDTGMAFVLISHLAPDVVSHLTEIASRHTRMPVHPIIDGERPQSNELYILQPNDLAELVGGAFRIRRRLPEDRVSHPVDLFFRSLATDQRNNAIGVVLSGSDSDGALGLKAIKGEGGFSIVQTPDSAQHSGMPRNSIAADHVDMVLSPADIALELNRLARQFQEPVVRALESAEEPPTDAQSLARILQILQASSGLDIRQYKPDTIRRRIARRMVLQRRETLAEYASFLASHREEVRSLQEDVLIGVTQFFRDPSFWDAFSTSVLPAFFRDRAPGQAVRIWCAGCSSGEEAYSAAIALVEYTTAHGIETNVQIFGTDASERSIEMARPGIYPETLAGEINSERLRRFFVKVDRGYQVSKRVRDLCIFAKQNLCSDPPFSHIDFLFCRNVMIYFNQVLQRQVLATFHYALEPAAYLLLGSAESLREYDEIFSPADRKQKIYIKIGGLLPSSFSLPFHRVIPTLEGRDPHLRSPHSIWSEPDLQRAADRIVLARYGPPGLIIDAQLNVLQARGHTAPYVELASGMASLSLPRILREQLASPVREAAERCIAGSLPVSRPIELVDVDGKPKSIRVDIVPISSPNEAARFYIILFVEIPEELRTADPSLTLEISPDDKDRLFAQLQQDLASTRFHLQSLVEERDARNQELVSANEEIQSSNEELQSSNEELETTKEELQSSNEELQTVNDELQQRNAVLAQTGNDLSNLLTSVNIPLLMLTDQLQIRQFTPPMERLLNIRQSDVGRLVSEIRLQLSIENIEPILREVLDTLGTREIEVQDREGRWHMLRIRPYRTADNKIEGLVMVLVDIHELRRSLQIVRESRDFADSVLEGVPVPVVVIGEDLNVRQANSAFRDLTRMQTRDLTGRFMPILFQSLWDLEHLQGDLESLFVNPGTRLNYEHQSPKQDNATLQIKGQVVQADGSRVILMTIEDVTLRRRSEDMAAGQKAALEREIERTTRTLHYAQTELQELTAHLFSVQEEERRRVARELHDDIAQRLSALQMQHEQSRRSKDGDYVAQAEVIYRALDSLNTDVRAISHRLHPSLLEDLGLVEALQTLVQEFGNREDILASFLSTNVQDHVPIMTATTMYRVAQEALRNVAKHAGQAHVKVLLEEQDGLLRLEVRDSGLGFDPAEQSRSGLGFVSMRERARIAQGTLEVQSSLGRGTVVLLTIPLEGARENDA